MSQPWWNNVQRQQHEQHEKMMQAAWLEQKKREQQRPAGDIASSQQLDQRFGNVEKQAELLRQRYHAGLITRETLETELRGLMLQDGQGTWWMIGAESGHWYLLEGNTWRPGTPPQQAGLSGAVPGTPRRRQWFRAFLVLVIGLAVSIVAFFAAGGGSYQLLQDSDVDASAWSLVIACAAGIICLMATLTLAARAGRRGR
jgi:hypothetical protein